MEKQLEKIKQCLNVEVKSETETKMVLHEYAGKVLAGQVDISQCLVDLLDSYYGDTVAKILAYITSQPALMLYTYIAFTSYAVSKYPKLIRILLNSLCAIIESDDAVKSLDVPEIAKLYLACRL